MTSPTEEPEQEPVYEPEPIPETSDPGVQGPEPEQQPDPVPEPVPAPSLIAWEPRTWYSITYACRNQGCANQNRIYAAPMFYSNNGVPAYIRVVDSTCNKDSTILTATKLDPQPVEE